MGAKSGLGIVLGVLAFLVGGAFWYQIFDMGLSFWVVPAAGYFHFQVFQHTGHGRPEEAPEPSSADLTGALSCGGMHIRRAQAHWWLLRANRPGLSLSIK